MPDRDDRIRDEPVILDAVVVDSEQIASGDREETVDGVAVLAEVRAIQPAATGSLPAVHAVAVAATGFVAGAATLALVRRRGTRRLARARLSQQRRGIDALPIVGSRRFLVDVHLIAKPGD